MSNTCLHWQDPYSQIFILPYISLYYTIYRYIDAPYLNDEELLASDTTDYNTSSSYNNSEGDTGEYKEEEENSATNTTAAPATSVNKNSKYITNVYLCIILCYTTILYSPYTSIFQQSPQRLQRV